MNIQALHQLVAHGESERLEFKRSTGQRSDAGKTVCAMLNGVGGIVLFGVQSNGTIAGQQIVPTTLEDVTNEFARIEPPAFPKLQVITLDSGLGVLAVNVTGGGGPYTFDGRPYIRSGPTNRVMPRQQYNRVLLERMPAMHR